MAGKRRRRILRMSRIASAGRRGDRCQWPLRQGGQWALALRREQTFACQRFASSASNRLRNSPSPASSRWSMTAGIRRAARRGSARAARAPVQPVPTAGSFGSKGTLARNIAQRTCAPEVLEREYQWPGPGAAKFEISPWIQQRRHALFEQPASLAVQARDRVYSHDS